MERRAFNKIMAAFPVAGMLPFSNYKPFKIRQQVKTLDYECIITDKSIAINIDINLPDFTFIKGYGSILQECTMLEWLSPKKAADINKCIESYPYKSKKINGPIMINGSMLSKQDLYEKIPEMTKSTNNKLPKYKVILPTLGFLSKYTFNMSLCSQSIKHIPNNISYALDNRRVRI